MGDGRSVARMTWKAIDIDLEGEYVVGSGRMVILGQELVEAITHFNLARDAAFSAEVEIGSSEPISVTVTGEEPKKWDNPDCDAGYHARTKVSFRRWPFIWRTLTEWRCWNCDWVEL